MTLRQRVGFIGVNGSATYSCTFDDVFIPDVQVIATEVDEFIERIRSQFLVYQIPLALGVTESSVETMIQLTEKHERKDSNINRYLPIQPEQIKEKNNRIRSLIIQAIANANIDWPTLVDIRLQSVYVTLEAVQAAMLHHGGRAYVKSSVAERKLREAYFLVNLTPTIKHLEVLRQQIAK